MSQQLINRELISSVLVHEAPWSNTHGAYGDFLGMGLIYYAIVYVKKALTAVCLGSGGGFVPRLMRQAQRDLGIADQSKTILVDANRPEAGWGAPLWLDQNSFFRNNFGDIDLIIKTTDWAAENYFTERGIQIDYLHIDANHSFRACLGDFQCYRPFLKEGSMVTLHDTSFPGAGVKPVMDYIRTRDDCEIIDFPEIGAGTALIRISRNTDELEFDRKSERFGAYTDAVIITRKPDIRPTAPPKLDWKYLQSEAFSSRNVLAAYFVRNCPSVIEIGSAKRPIHQFLRERHESVIVIDPNIREARKNSLNGSSCRIYHIRALFQDVVWTIQRPKEYGLVMLGMELQGLRHEDYKVLFRLVENAKITVIEFATSWEPAREQYNLIRRNTNTRVRFTSKLHLTGNNVGNLKHSWPPRFDREIYVLEPI